MKGYILMKKFSKIIFLLLALVAIVTAFTVVSFAADEGASLTPATVHVNDFESYAAAGDTFQNNAKAGKWMIDAADNGNKYLAASYDPKVGTETRSENWDFSIPNASTHGIHKYPTFALDFDVMSPTGTYSSDTTIRADLYGATSAGNRISQGLSFKVNSISLPSAKAQWNHVTITIHSDISGIVTGTVYVNGEQTYTKVVDYNTTAFTSGYNANIKNWSNLVSNGEYKYTNISFGVISMYGITSNSSLMICYDNLQYSYYPAEYSADEIARYIYNDDYKMPYGSTVAKNGDKVYDNANEAMNDAEVGDTVTLVTNVTSPIVVDKEILVDTNVYDANGNITETFYNASFTSSLGYVATETASGSGIYSFAKAEETVTVIWDGACEEDCDCYAEFGGHRLTATTSATLGMIPEYFGNIPTFLTDYSNNTRKVFVGWSYENDGRADVITAITEDDIANGTLKLYPVYKTLIYTMSVYNKTTGVTYYYTEDQFTTAIAKALDGSTLVLIRDTYVECGEIALDKSLTIDLNGHKLMRCNVYGNVYEAVRGEDGTFICDTAGAATAVSKSGNFFQIKKNSLTLTIKSTVDGGAIYNACMKADVWTYNGETVKRISSAVEGGRIANMSYKNSSAGFSLVADNVSIYSGTLWYQDSASANNFKITLNKTNYYKIGSSETTIQALSDQNVTITMTDSLIYTPANNNFILLGTNNNYTGVACNVTFTNCDIIKPDSSYATSINDRRPKTTNIVFDSCRLYDVQNVANTSTLTNGSLEYYFYEKDSGYNTSNLPVADGYTKVNTSITKSYVVPASFSFAVDSASEVNRLTFEFKTTTKTLTFNRVASKPVNVNWVDGEGNTTTESLYPGTVISAPKNGTFELVDDNYRNIVYQWADSQESGKAIPKYLGFNTETYAVDFETTEYTFYEVTEINGVANYTPVIKNAMFNLGYMGHFAYNIYVPVQDGVTLTFLGDYGAESGKIYVVKIDGVEYWTANSGWISPAKALENQTADIKYIIDGKSYSKQILINSLYYTDLLFNSPDTQDVEKDAVIAMMAYVEEAYKALAPNATLDETTQAKFDTFFANHNKNSRPDYITEYPEAELQTVNVAAISKYIKSIAFAIHTDNRLSLIVTLTAEAERLGYHADVDNIASEMKRGKTNDDGTVVYYTDNTPLTSCIMAPKFTIMVCDASGKVVSHDHDNDETTANVLAKTDYSIATYCNSVESNLADALYTFGKKAILVKEYIKSL